MINFKTASDVALEVAKKTENSLLMQLNEFISRDLIEVRETQPIFVRSKDGTVCVEKAIELVLKDQEYMEKLEEENKYLKDTLRQLKDLLSELTDSVDQPQF